MESSGSSGPNRGRRNLVSAAACLALSGLLPRAARAGAGPAQHGRRMLRFYNTHTGEKSRTVYWAAGGYLPEGLSEIAHILRDHRSGEVSRIAPPLLDLVHDLDLRLGGHHEIHIISGYRSPATNAALAARSGGVSTRSLHMAGQAIDLRIPTRRLEDVRRVALAMKSGGVGYYPGSGFVHVDIGRVRSW